MYLAPHSGHSAKQDYLQQISTKASLYNDIIYVPISLFDIRVQAFPYHQYTPFYQPFVHAPVLLSHV